MSIRDAARTAWLNTQGSSESEARGALFTLFNDNQTLVDSLDALFVDFADQSVRWFFEDTEGLILRVSKRPSNAIWLTNLVEEESPGVWIDKGQVTSLQQLWTLLPPEAPSSIIAWTAGETVVPGDIRSYESINYKCLQGHTTQAGWTPPATPALWEVML